MRMKCEAAVRDVFPVARAMIAKNLVDVYKFSQIQASRRMGISQPAISQYRKNIRGSRRSLAEDRRFMEIADDIAKRIAEGSLHPEHLQKEMCRFCRLLGD
jgi:predicted transcriptional regulator